MSHEKFEIVQPDLPEEATLTPELIARAEDTLVDNEYLRFLALERNLPPEQYVEANRYISVPEDFLPEITSNQFHTISPIMSQVLFEVSFDPRWTDEQRLAFLDAANREGEGDPEVAADHDGELLAANPLLWRYALRDEASQLRAFALLYKHFTGESPKREWSILFVELLYSDLVRHEAFVPPELLLQIPAARRKELDELVKAAGEKEYTPHEAPAGGVHKKFAARAAMLRDDDMRRMVSMLEEGADINSVSIREMLEVNPDAKHLLEQMF